MTNTHSYMVDLNLQHPFCDPEEILMVNLSGRGDKDIGIPARKTDLKVGA